MNLAEKFRVVIKSYLDKMMEYCKNSSDVDYHTYLECQEEYRKIYGTAYNTVAKYSHKNGSDTK